MHITSKRLQCEKHKIIVRCMQCIIYPYLCSSMNKAGMLWDSEVPQELKDASIVTIFKKGSRTECGDYRNLPSLSRWQDPCKSSPGPTETSLGKYYPRNTMRFQTRTRHYGHDDCLCPSRAGEMQGTRVSRLLSIYRPYQGVRLSKQRSPVGMPCPVWVPT